MVTQQVVAPPARAGMFLVLTVDDGSEDVVRDLLGDLSDLVKAVSFRNTRDDLNLVVGIGADVWGRLFGELPRPRQLHPFEALEGPRHVAPATPGDLLLHLRARSMDQCFELARQVATRLEGHAVVVDETHGFKYFDERDLLGFVDGTASPRGADGDAVVLIGDEDPAYAGGSYVVVQKYLHDLAAWDAISVEEQERVIGRTKLDDIELPDSVKPSNSHVVVNTIVDEEGVEHDIVRDNLPFGEIGAGEYGTYFIGYAADVGIIELMLRRMFIGEPPGNTDRILDFSTAVTGSLFFVPSLAFLDDPPDPVDATPAPTAPVSPAPSAGSGDLGIGSLRRSPGATPS
ncbi:putative iron-dependent peroxidase [Salana multivorans]|uniref:Putative iron-dependent peroxidase n=1 Tax=Salana multivorans TaxID=120377 RepID=A0A3N2D0P9_9MICO|nr:Dyp-type peroxidase [Salana multivorans]ROR93323.1 putative iron-dependent peroxidase [Salana multivorans]